MTADISARIRELQTSEFHSLAETLGELPRTTEVVHSLRRSLCRAWVVGPTEGFRAAIVQFAELPDEPEGFGSDARALWAMLSLIDGWSCFHVRRDVSEELAAIMENDLSNSILRSACVYYVLRRVPPPVHHEKVRLFKIGDLNMLRKALKEVQGMGFGTLECLLRDGVVACGVVEETIASIVYTSSLITSYAEQGAFALPEYRQQGMAMSAASLVAKRVQEIDRIPVWSCVSDNIASVQVAEGLGFEGVENTEYLIRVFSPRD